MVFSASSESSRTSVLWGLVGDYQSVIGQSVKAPVLLVSWNPESERGGALPSPVGLFLGIPEAPKYQKTSRVSCSQPSPLLSKVGCFAGIGIAEKWNLTFELVGRQGLEPCTLGLKVPCSTG